MAEIKIWDGTATFSAGMTPFGFYDSDAEFASEAVKVSKFCATRLGYPMMDVELQSGSFFACFEEAVTTYGNLVFQYKIRENYISMEGASTTTSANSKIVNPSLQRMIKMSQEYGTEAEVGGKVTRYTGSLALTQSVQNYDLDAWAVQQGITGSIEVRRVFYESPPAIMRYFDPYAGTGTGIQSLMDAFDFGSMSPGINFLLMPASYDILKVQAIEFNDQIRRSSYSFEMVNNKLKIFPVPKKAGSLYFEYYEADDKADAVTEDGTDKITNVGEVPYDNPTFLKINTPGRDWIYRYTLALAKELLAYVRGKYQTVPVPGSEATLNQADLLTDARAEKEKLLTELTELLQVVSRQSQLESQAAQTDALNTTLKGVPMTIFVG
jgi:hypothetical protein